MDLNFNANRDLPLFNHEMQANGTMGESLLWYHGLKARKMGGYQFHRRYPVNDSTVDFISLKIKLIIEITISKPDLITAEPKRDDDLRSLGYTVLNFTESEVIDQFENVIERIKDTMEQIKDRGKGIH